MKSSGMLTVGEIAARFGLAAHVLRHWESVGVLTPARDANGRRRYGPDDIYRVAVILRAKEAGLGLPAIRAILTARDPAARTGILRHHRAVLARTIAAAQESLELIEGALSCGHGDLFRCPNFRSWIVERIEPAIDGQIVSASTDSSGCRRPSRDRGSGTRASHSRRQQRDSSAAGIPPSTPAGMSIREDSGTGTGFPEVV